MGKIKLLLVEDHVVVREGTRQLLENERDMEVIGEAGDGEEAVRLAKQLKPDVIIMDVSMPKLSGLEATKQIKDMSPSSIVLILTGYDYDEYIFSLLESGAAGYLLKDVTGDELIQAVRRVYAGEQALHPVVVRKLVDRFKSQAANPPDEIHPLSILSEREMEVLKAAAKGNGNKEIADGLFISIRTVQAHMRSIFNKLGVGSRSEAIIYGLRRAWFKLEDLP
ncbi:MAG: response regulator transcription factor [Desulfobacteraceae bacterium]|nr:response regulator transcription factor [Desulfobacteraceae bacterium]